jgi:glycosyltransferase involved in cell wall biosynthesis
MGQLAVRSASVVLAVSRANLSEVRRWTPGSRAKLLYHGFDGEAFPYCTEKRSQVVTIGTVSKEYLQRKGLDTFARTSRLMPDVDFIVAGKILDEQVARRLREMGSPRLQIAGHLSQSEMVRLLRETAVYAQLSVHEAFGCSVAEAMLCGCTPVVSDQSALPEVVGECGYYVPTCNPEASAQAISLALTEPKGSTARARIIREFPQKRRMARLQDYLIGLVNHRPDFDYAVR